MNSVPKSIDVYAKFSRPSGEGLCFTERGYVVVFACIVVLFLASSPFAIVRTISEVIVDAFNRVFFGRSSAHVFIETGKASLPRLADSYSAPSISRVVLVGAPCLHLFPCLVFGGSRHPMLFGFIHWLSPLRVSL